MRRRNHVKMNDKIQVKCIISITWVNFRCDQIQSEWPNTFLLSLTSHMVVLLRLLSFRCAPSDVQSATSHQGRPTWSDYRGTGFGDRTWNNTVIIPGKGKVRTGGSDRFQLKPSKCQLYKGEFTQKENATSKELSEDDITTLRDYIVAVFLILETRN